MSSECCKILEPGTVGSNTPIYICIQSQYKSIGITVSKPKKVAKYNPAISMRGKPVYAIHSDGTVIKYSCAKACEKGEHTDLRTIAKYLDKDRKRWNMSGVQFRSKRPRK